MSIQYYSKESPILNRRADEVGIESDALSLKAEDKDLVRIIDQRIQDSKQFYNSDRIDLYNRRQKNKDFLRGNQLNVRNMKRYQTPYVDNLIYEAESMIKPIALSRMPDLLVKPAKDTQESKDLAANMTKVINSDIRKRENRRVLGVAWKHLPVYFQGVIKAYWDPNETKIGDYKFKVVHPENIVLDHTCPTNNPEDMQYIAEEIELTVKDVCVRFPKKADEFEKKVGVSESNREEKMASTVKIWEVWFKTWEKEEPIKVEKKTASENTKEEAKWREIEAVVWKYDDIVLGKMKNPYWDWVGDAKLTDIQGNPLPLQSLPDALSGELPSELGKVYHNYFNSPQKPYIFINYDLWGEYPLDYTSRIEQSIAIQENINKRGMQISEMNDQARGKHVFSTKSGLTKKDIERLDLDNPKQDLVVSGPLNETHHYIAGTPAPAGLYKELNDDKERLFSKMGTNSTTRGERGGEETAMGRQILREADYGRIDDTVEDTINYAAEKMAMWAMQFIKLFYTDEHIVRVVGPEGTTTFQQITQDSVEDGMEIIVSASGVDKLMAKREAYERARLGLTDPLSFFIDVSASDPKGRTEKLLMMQTAPELYMQKFVMNQTTNMMANTIAPGVAPVDQGTTAGAPQTVPGVNMNEPNPNLRRTPALFETAPEGKPL